MLDAVDPRLDDSVHGLARSTVRGDQAVQLPGGLFGRRELRDRVRRASGVRAERAAAARHDLDVVGSLRNQAPNGLANRFLSIGLLAAPVEVAAGGGDRASGDEHPRPVDEAAVDRQLDVEAEAVPRAVVPCRRDSRRQMGPGVPRGCQRHQAVGLGGHLLVGSPIGEQRHVHVGIHEARQCRERRVVQGAGRPFGRCIRERPDPRDPVVLETDDPVGDRRSSEAIDQEADPNARRGHQVRSGASKRSRGKSVRTSQPVSVTRIVSLMTMRCRPGTKMPGTMWRAIPARIGRSSSAQIEKM